MKLTVRRSQEASAHGIRFLVSFHLALRAEEQDLVRLYDLAQHRVGGWPLAQLMQGVQYEGGLSAIPLPAHIAGMSVIRAHDALRVEQATRDACRDFLAVLVNLRDFDDTEEYLYEMDPDPA